MRGFAAIVWMVVWASAGAVSAQGDDLDTLMSDDPARPAKTRVADDDDASDERGVSEDALRMSDDERPPGEENDVVDATPTERDVEAETDGHPKPVSLGVLAGYGINLESGGNAWSFGFGLRGGYNLSAVYLGARFVYYIGETYQATTIGVFGERFTDEATVNLWEVGFEGGYDIDAGSLSFRPGLGFGFANVSSVQSKTAFYVAPGLSAFYPISDSVFLGLDARYQAVMTTPATASGLVFLANLGMRL
jgi:hypothetical protein